MTKKSWFLSLILIITAFSIFNSTVSMAFAPAPKVNAVTLEQCLQMTPVQMAENSPMVQKSFAYLISTAHQISDNTLRAKVLDCLNNPAPTMMKLYPSNVQKEDVKKKLVAAGYIKSDSMYDQFLPPCQDPNKTTQPFFSAPGSGYQSHHSYPGGLATHAAVNLQVAVTLFHAYQDVYGYQVDKDVVIAAQILHDLAKPWVFQWQEDGSSLTEYPIAGTGAHHILGIAEAVYRELPGDVVVAIACAHTHPGSNEDEAQVVNWIKAACILTGKDPVKLGLLAADGQTVPVPRKQEGFITHLGDHDFVFTVPAAKWMIAELSEIAKSEYGMSDADLKGKKFNAFRNYLFSRVSAEYLHQVWVENGRPGLVKVVKTMVK